MIKAPLQPLRRESGDKTPARYPLHVLFLLAVFAGALRAEGPLVLDGEHLTIEAVLEVARGGRAVEIRPDALARVDRGYRLVVAAADRGIPIYGVNRGVGLNKDKTLFEGSILNRDAREKSERFNRNNLLATSAATGPAAPEDVTRATLLIRLNKLLTGRSGARPELALKYAELLNRGITPVLPSQGSVGQADITILSHIGLAMMGEGDVFYKGRRVPAAEALARENLVPLVPFARDSLAIMSCNAYSTAIATLGIHETEKLVRQTHDVVALSFEGLNGNLAPLFKSVSDLRPFCPSSKCASRIRRTLKGSYLNDFDPNRPLQDPLSFRTVHHQLGTAESMLHNAKAALSVQLNSSDDNPAAIMDARPSPKAGTQERSYFVTSGPIVGAVVPTAGFDPTPWLHLLDAIKSALSRLSTSSTERINRLGSEEKTHLSRFLTPNPDTLGFSAIQKVPADLAIENQRLAAPAHAGSFSLAGDMEDVATDAPRVALDLLKVAANYRTILGIELMHAAQAVDLRLKASPDLRLGKHTLALFRAYRAQVPFLDRDRALTPDIEASRSFLETAGTPPPTGVEACKLSKLAPLPKEPPPEKSE